MFLNMLQNLHTSNNQAISVDSDNKVCNPKQKNNNFIPYYFLLHGWGIFQGITTRSLSFVIMPGCVVILYFFVKNNKMAKSFQ